MTEYDPTENVLDDTDVVIDDETREVIETPVYTFQLTHKTTPDYTMSLAIIEWIQSNLESILDDYNKRLFGKVNCGFNEEALRSFGKRPVAEVYIDNVEYNGDFEGHPPVQVNTVVLFYMKGANNNTYLKACTVHDYLMQEFLTNDTFKKSDVVRDTVITNSEIRNQPVGKVYGVVGALQLSHTLYQ